MGGNHMAATGLDVFDGSVHKSNQWLDALARGLGSDDRRYAYRVLRAYFHVLRDRLTVDEAARLAARLPQHLRGVFYEDWDPRKRPETYGDRDTFLARLADGAELAGPTDAALAAEAATEMLRDRVDPRRALADLRTDYADTATEMLRERAAGQEKGDLLEVLPATVRTLLQPAGQAPVASR
jgi:uncharacterized protein (DUF2267 family)